jgi:small subunit ribosomal protein S7
MRGILKKLKKPPIEIFKEALEVITPKIEVRSRRIGGATYQIPVEVSARRGSALALKWLKTSIENIKGKKLSNKVVIVILESLENKGWAAKKKEEVFKMAEANKAFAHYRW